MPISLSPAKRSVIMLFDGLNVFEVEAP